MCAHWHALCTIAACASAGHASLLGQEMGSMQIQMYAQRQLHCTVRADKCRAHYPTCQPEVFLGARGWCLLPPMNAGQWPQSWGWARAEALEWMPAQDW